MDANELLAALNLEKPKPTTVASDSSGGEIVRPEENKVTLSEFCVAGDLWTERKGEEHTGACETGESTSLRAKTAADIFAACFEFAPAVRDSKRTKLKRYMEAVLDSPGFHALRVETRFDETKTVQSMERIAAGYKAFLEATKNEPEDGEGNGDDAGEKGERKGKGKGRGGDMSAEKAAGEALGQAQADCEALSDLEKALSGSATMGGRGAIPGDRVDAKVLLSAFHKVRKNDSLRKKFELAGRLKEVAAAKQRAKNRAGIDEVVGMECGNEVTKLLATELGRLGDDDLELDFLRRFVDRLTLQRHHLGSEKTAQGPIVCVVDESGSMCGEKEIHAKALALTLSWVASFQNRWYCLVSFTGSSCGRYLICAPGKEPVWYEVDHTDHDSYYNCLIPGKFKEKKRGPEATFAFVESFMNGGSNLDLPFDILPQVWEQIGAPRGKTDIIMITDCHLEVPSKIGNRWNDFRKAEKARVSVYVVGENVAKKDGKEKLQRIVSKYCDEIVMCPAKIDENSIVAHEVLDRV